jgi:hypothetical protein
MAPDDSLVKNCILIHFWGTYFQALAKLYWYIIYVALTTNTRQKFPQK